MPYLCLADVAVHGLSDISCVNGVMVGVVVITILYQACVRREEKLSHCITAMRQWKCVIKFCYQFRNQRHISFQSENTPMRLSAGVRV